jgi:hypothetical protein
MHRKQRRTLRRSFDWIREHPGATNLDVPTDLIDQWIFEDDDEDPKPMGFFMSVFTFGFLQQEVLADGFPPEQSRSVPVSRLLECFGVWQLKLGLAEIHRRTEMRLEPSALFAFPDGEELRYRLGTSTNNPGPAPVSPEQ